MKNLNDLILKPAPDNLKCNRPWLKFYPSDSPANIDYPDNSIYDLLEFTASNIGDNNAVEFLGRDITFKNLLQLIDNCAKGLINIGVKKGDKVTVCLPNTPHATIVFYAINKIGAISNVVHPLSAPKELEYYINLTKSKFVITINFSFMNFEKIIDNVNLKKIVVCKLGNFLKSAKRLGFWTTAGRKIPKIPKRQDIIKWKDLLKLGEDSLDKFIGTNGLEFPQIKGKDPAVILYTGGTTGKQKGVLLSNLNFNALALQTISQVAAVFHDKMMCIMPFFHGFGLGVTMHTTLVFGGKIILVPKFTVEEFAKTYKKHKPEFIAGVPTLFTSLIKHKKMVSSDFSNLKGVFSGADTLPNEIKIQFEDFISQRGATVPIREGYGLTETVTACCLTPENEYRFGSIGIPFPDTLFKIIKPGTFKSAGIDEDGEICIHGPSVMLGYYNEKEETDNVLRTHEDGKLWLHTGDLGSMDRDGFVYFKQRIKRIIKHSGYSIFPSQIEEVLINHEAVANACVVGVPDKYQMEKIRAYIVLEEDYKKYIDLSAIDLKNLDLKNLDLKLFDLKKDLLKRCKEYLSHWSLPQEFIFRDELPVTKVGKIDYVTLEKEILNELNKKNLNIYKDIQDTNIEEDPYS